jgi:hypothetical protein
MLLFTAARAKAAAASPARNGELLRLAESEFPNLTRAERALLEFADIKNHVRGEFAFAGASTVPADPSNDPEHADQWDAQRSVRAELIRWLCVDPDASRMVDPLGIRLLGARITGKVDLSHVHVPFGIALVRCWIPERINFESTETSFLDLNGSSTAEIYAPSMVVHSDAAIGWDGRDYGGPFRASGEVYLPGARVDGTLSFGAGRFHRSAASPEEGNLPAALDLHEAAVKGGAVMCCGFEAHGAVILDRAIVGYLGCTGGHFINPGGPALTALSATVQGDVYLSEQEAYGDFEADGMVQFVIAHVGGLFYVHRAKFLGAPEVPHGLDATGLTAKNFIWQKIDHQNSAELNLNNATVETLGDDEQSWPAPGRLTLDGFAYTVLGPPTDAASRLRWLALQPPGLHLQPYRQLAEFLRRSGDEPGAVRVLIAEEDARYARFGPFGRLGGSLLKSTIGYGHRPLLTVLWALAIIALGWGVVTVAARANLMRPTYPENPPAGGERRYERLHPLLYSIDVFFPFVNLHQEHYWWPDADVSGEWRIIGRSLPIDGSLVRYYLWFQIGAGWLLSAIFLAGVTGLLRYA